MYVTSFGVSLNSCNLIASDMPLVNRGLEQASPSLGIRNTVRPVLSGLSDAIMLELFKETPKDVTYTLMGLENIY